MDLTKATDFIQNKLSNPPEMGIVLGSGLGEFINIIKNKIEIKFNDIPGFVLPSVFGHDGKLILGEMNGKSIICTQGRVHFYEGISLDEVTFQIQLFNKIKCKKVIITNSSGCLQKEWNIGGFMNISSLLDFTFRKSDKPIISSLKQVYDFETVKEIAHNNGFDFYNGTYTWTLGPSYETPSEVDEINNLDGRVVGMSTYPEMTKAVELGLDVIGISCLTNYAAGISENPLTHEEVLHAAKMANKNFSKLIEVIIENI